MTNFFGPASPYLTHPLLTEERTSTEVDHLVRILGLDVGQTVLDVGCGFGRHSLELARRGLRPTGIDPSETMIAAARQTARQEQLEATFTVGSGEAGINDRFEGAIAMFTTLGQVGPGDSDNLGLLARTAEALSPGARFVLEVPQRGPAVAGLVTEDRFGEGDNRTEITRRFDGHTNRVIERFTVVTDGKPTEFDLAYRLFSAEELTGHLEVAGFTDIQLTAELAALPASAALDPEAPTIYASAAAPG